MRIDRTSQTAHTIIVHDYHTSAESDKELSHFEVLGFASNPSAVKPASMACYRYARTVVSTTSGPSGLARQSGRGELPFAVRRASVTGSPGRSAHPALTCAERLEVAPVHNIDGGECGQDADRNSCTAGRLGGVSRRSNLLPTWAGFLYLAVVMNAWGRRISGWALATHHAPTDRARPGCVRDGGKAAAGPWT